MNIRKRKALKAKAIAARQGAQAPQPVAAPVVETPAPAPVVESETPLLDAVEAEEVTEVAPEPEPTTRKKTTKED
jgi:hypothetical protein